MSVLFEYHSYLNASIVRGIRHIYKAYKEYNALFRTRQYSQELSSDYLILSFSSYLILGNYIFKRISKAGHFQKNKPLRLTVSSANVEIVFNRRSLTYVPVKSRPWVKSLSYSCEYCQTLFNVVLFETLFM